MTKQLEEAIEMFGSTCGNFVKTPGAPYLREVNKNSERLDTEKLKIFHSVAAKILYDTKQTRPDIEPEVAYFTTQVENINVDGWKKMRHYITFLKQNKQDKQIIGCFDLKEIFTWVDSLFAVHPNMRIHTGGAMYMGYGMIHFHSSKQKLNKKSITESQLVGISKYVPFNIWIVMFYESQGYEITNNVIFQYN